MFEDDPVGRDPPNRSGLRPAAARTQRLRRNTREVYAKISLVCKRSEFSMSSAIMDDSCRTSRGQYTSIEFLTTILKS